jgi:hypothetical protein
MGNRLEREAELFLRFKNYFDEKQMTLPKLGEVVPGAQSFADVPRLISDTLYLRYDFLIGLRNYLAVYENSVYNKEIEILFKITPFVQAVKQVLSARFHNTEIQLKQKLQMRAAQSIAEGRREPEGYFQVLRDVSRMCSRKMVLILINTLIEANKVQWEMFSENIDFAELLEIGKYHHYLPMREFLSSAIQCLVLSLVPALLDDVKQQKCKKKSKFFHASQEITVTDVVDVCKTVLEEEQGLDDEDYHSSLTSIIGNPLPTGNHVFFARISEFGVMLSIFFANLVQCLCMVKFFEKENTIGENAGPAVPLRQMCI